MKKQLRLLSVLLIFGIMVCSLLSLTACEEDSGSGDSAPGENNGSKYLTYRQSGDESYCVVTGYTGSEKNVIIPQTYNDKPVKEIAPAAFGENTSITSVILPEGITRIGNYAFDGCTALSSVVIPASVSAIGDYAFRNCSRLKTATISENSELWSIGEGAFSYCSALISITIPENSELWSIGEEAFSYCSALTGITIPASVREIGNYAFRGCYKLLEVYNLSTSYVGYVGHYELNVYTSLNTPSKLCTIGDYIFYVDGAEVFLVSYIGTATELTLPQSYNGGDYGIYRYAFYRDSNIRGITIPASVSSIGYSAFGGCTGLKTVAFSAGSRLTDIDTAAFDGCVGLTSIEIPESVESIGFSVFYNCTALTSVSFADTSSWYRADTFIDCSSKVNGIATDVTVAEANATYFKSTYKNDFWYKI